MNKTIAFSCLCFILLAPINASAQVAAEYYFPLRVGNSWVYHTPGNPPGWIALRVHIAIQKIDTISGTPYYRKRCVEIPDANPSDSSIFQVLWLRPDSAGNILIGAFSDNSTDINSATRLESPLPYFPNQFLTAGYSRVQIDSTRKVNYKDSVMSTTESVTVTAGTFTNCLKVRERQKDSLGVTTLVEIAFYARNIGEVKRVREVPSNQAHTNELIGYNIVTAVEEEGEKIIPDRVTLRQNYPNPFNPTTTITFSVGTYGHTSLRVFDMLGREIATLVEGELSEGEHSVIFSAGGLPSGVYFYRIIAGSFVENKTMVLIR